MKDKEALYGTFTEQNKTTEICVVLLSERTGQPFCQYGETVCGNEQSDLRGVLWGRADIRPGFSDRYGRIPFPLFCRP